MTYPWAPRRRRRLIRQLRHGFSHVGHAALAGLGAGLVTYGALKGGGRLMQPLARRIAHRAPHLANEMRAFASRGEPLNWAIGNSLVAGTGALGAGWASHRRRRRRRAYESLFQGV